MNNARLLLAVGSLVMGGSMAAFGIASCAQTATNVPVRTFERAQRVDVVCMRVLGPDPNNLANTIAIPPQPQVQEQCAPVPAGVDGSTLPFHLYALVTQTSRGEVAVVDLTSGNVVDSDRSTPGINFLPVGNFPTDVAVTPEGDLSFVAAAEANKPAIYAIPNRDILGDSQGLGVDASPPAPTLPLWPSCALPEAPGSIAVVPRAVTSNAGDAGTGAVGYDLAVVLPGDGSSPAKIVMIDPQPFLRGANIDTSVGQTVGPGTLSPCPIRAAIALSPSRPSTFVAGPSWEDGIKYVDGGIDAAASEPQLSSTCASGSNVDSGTGGILTPSVSSAGEIPHATRAVRDGQILYVGDDAVPIIHVIDLSNPASPLELAPLLATSLIEPTRRVAVRDLAVSPTTSDYKRYLYAIDGSDGSILVYDITDPDTMSRSPLTRPHTELNPFQAPDRIAFSSPVASVSFVRHDFVLQTTGQFPLLAAKSGLICNPNPNAGTSAALVTAPVVSSDQALGAYYRADVPNQELSLGPARLRGIFAFATLTNGQVVAIDVDDWDAPCRRPDPLDALHAASSVAPGEPPPTSSQDLDPYHVPFAYEPGSGSTPVSLESYFPVSAPHRPRSINLLVNDPRVGVHVPTLVGQPQLFAVDAPLATTGASASNNPLLLPTATNLADPTYVANPTEPDPSLRTGTFAQDAGPPVFGSSPALSLPPVADAIVAPGVRFAWEDPQVQIDQDWTVTFEGVLPNFDGLATTIDTTDGFQSLLLNEPGALFCRRGIEDFGLGTSRARAAESAAVASNIPSPVRLDHRMADYVQLTDDMLDPTDPYWTEPNACWDPSLSNPADRYNACIGAYGLASDQSVERDFPILQSFDDHLIVGRFNYPSGSAHATTSREVTNPDPSNVPFLKQMQCCFHNQVHFNVRAGGQWVAVGSSVGFLHHIERDPASGACVTSCEQRNILLNARAPGLPRPTDPMAVPPDRNSVLAMRNPMFSFLVWDGVAMSGSTQTDVIPGRDFTWKFSTRGEFTPLSINIAASTTAVAPQSMRFIESLGQLAVVDGASQGLVLIDLNTVAEAHAPYF